MISKEEAKAILSKAIGFSKADGCEATLNHGIVGNIRYARNTVTTAGKSSDTSINITSYFGKRAGVATVNEFDDAALERGVRASEELAKLAPENPEFMEPLGPQTFAESKTYYENTAAITPEFRAQAAYNSMTPAAKADVTAAGYMEDGSYTTALMNSKGLFAYNSSTSGNFTVTMRSNDGTGSGWASRDFNDVSKFNAAEASQIAIDKALQSRNAKAIEPGKYTVIMEAQAVADLLINMLFNMDARSADEGRSFLSKKGGGTRLHEKIVDERINIYTDPLHPDAPASTWSAEGLQQKKLDLIKNGTVANMLYDRYWASQKNMQPVPFPPNVIMEGGTASLDDMIRDTKRGVLVTRFWYIRSVDPQTLLYTGLTRDGVFYVENGKIKHPVKNFRFNESPVIMLNNVETLGKQTRIGRQFGPGGALVIPNMKVRDFTFTSLSDAV
ncbi:MAG TPA: TldD/PmbA family protein [Cyclobacteriaceae bacterium]|nr:TldD/PmbA family protein [Cyclobacteriaceae bacterium]